VLFLLSRRMHFIHELPRNSSIAYHIVIFNDVKEIIRYSYRLDGLSVQKMDVLQYWRISETMVSINGLKQP